ncbi:MAG: MotA/TolQ/ExbB proton channel family protein, partial [Chitinispirillaceae bacterium]|nr:MotA/TolQ/ExbB proton channel family protein [Chitinispirillaceae bacterium]
MSFMSMFLYSFNTSQAGWAFMWIILAAGVFGVAIVLERLFFLTSRSAFRVDLFVKDIVANIQNNDIAAAQRMADKAGKMALAQVFTSALREAGAGAERIRNAVDETTLRVIPQLEKRTTFLGMIGNIATLLGLMGTIYGLIIAFAAVGKPGIDPAEKSTLLAQGIAAAMNTTFLGLLIAIPMIFVYTYFKGKTQKIIDQIDEYSLRLVNVLVER